MKVDESNTIYVFKDNEKMDCPENLITHICLDDVSDLSNWFEDNLISIKEKYFIQFLFENGSFIRTHSAKTGFVKYIRIWKFRSANEFRGEIVLDYCYGNMRGLGNKSIPIGEFSEMLLNENDNETFSAKFRLHGCSKHPDYPKEPNLISDARKDQNNKLTNELNNNIPQFELKTLGIKPYEICINIDEKICHLITTKQALLFFLNEQLSDAFFNSDFIHIIHLEFRNNQNKKPQGEMVYFHFDASGYDGLNVNLDIHLNECNISAEKEVETLDVLVDLIFNLFTCDKLYLISEYKITDVMNKTEEKSIIKKLTKPALFSEGDLQKLASAIDFSERKMISFEDEDNSVQLAPISESDYCINFSYPSKEEPYSLFKKLNIDIPKDLNLSFWEANLACTFEFNVTEKIKLPTALFISQIFSNFLHVKYNELDITAEDF